MRIEWNPAPLATACIAVASLACLAHAHDAAPAAGRPAPVASASGRAGDVTKPNALAALDLAGGTIQALSPTIAADGSLALTLTIDGEPVAISAVPRSMRGPAFQLVLADGAGGAEAVVAAPPSRVFRGVVVGRPGSVASLSLRDGAVQGMLRLDGADGASIWGIQPLGDRPAGGGGPALHAVYRADEIAAPPGVCGGALLSDDAGAPPEGGIAGDGPCNQLCQIALDADVEYYVANGSSVENTVADMEAIMDAVEAIFYNDVGINYLITMIKVRTAEPDPYTSTGGSALLNEFKTWWNGNEQDVVRDVAHLFTGKNIDGTTIGIAYLATVCNLSSAYGVTQSKWSTNFVLRTATTTHELGHSWSAQHCNADPACAIMCSAINGCSGQVTFFEPGSKNTIIAYRDNASCLGPGPQAAPVAYDDALFAQAGIQDVLDVAANDVEYNCDPLTIGGLPAATAAGGAVEACAACAPDGGPAILYTAPTGFVGQDSFSYTVSDPFGASDSATTTVTVLALRVPENPAGAQPGLYTNVYLVPPSTQLPNFSQLAPLFPFVFQNLNFPSSNGEIFFSGQSDNVGAVFEGYFSAPTSDFYTLFLESSDGSRLWIGDTLIVDNDGLHAMVEKSGVVGLQAGLHKVRIEYFEATGSSGLFGRWKNSTIQKVIIPEANCFHVPPALFGDLTGDQKVNGADLGALLGQWGGPGAGDLNGDGIVDGADLGGLLAVWTG